MLLVACVSVLSLALVLGWLLARAGERAHRVDWGSAWLNRLDGINRILCRRYHRLRHDPIGLPSHGPALVACNHVSGLDPLLMLAATERPLRFLIAREEYERAGLTWLYRAVGCIPVDRGSRPENALRAALRTLQAGEVVAVFPHGRIHLDSDPPRKLKPGVVWLARQARCPIFPVRLSGIRAQGQVMRAPFIPSRAVLKAFTALDCQIADQEDCLRDLGAMLDAKSPPGVE